MKRLGDEKPLLSPGEPVQRLEEAAMLSVTRNRVVCFSALAACALAGAFALTGGVHTRAEERPKEDAKMVEPAAIGYPCILTAKNRAELNKLRPKEMPAISKEKRTRSRELYGENLYFSTNTNLWYWYSNSDSSDACSSALRWSSGHVIGFEEIQTCSNGGTGYRIWVSD